VGFTLYISFKEIHKYFNLKLISEIFILASIPAIALGVFQYFHGQKIFGFERIQSFFSEPSYYGDYLVLLLLPCLIKTFENFWHSKVTRKLFLIIYLITLIFSLYATQSGTSILKTLSLLLLSFMFFKIKKRYKILAGTFAFIIIAGIIYLKNGYIKEVTSRGIEILQNPDLFFKHHNYYDRFYPIYVSIIKLFSFEGIIGLGFGGDYFEFKNLFPASTHAEMMIHKPTFSYFNSFASKIILYFGIFGLAWLALQFYKAGKCKNDIIKIACLNVLISSLWGVSSFALPYIWFWLALVDIYYERLDHQS
jgi:hypothetical protein